MQISAYLMRKHLICILKIKTFSFYVSFQLVKFQCDMSKVRENAYLNVVSHLELRCLLTLEIQDVTNPTQLLSCSQGENKKLAQDFVKVYDRQQKTNYLFKNSFFTDDL